MEKFEKGDVNLSGLGDATLLDIATDPEMNDQLSNQAGEEIKRRQAEGTFDDTLPEAEDDGETAEDDYYEYEQRMGKIGEKAFRRHEDLNSKAYQRKQVELDKQGRGHSLKHFEVDRAMNNTLARAEGLPQKESEPREDAEILEKAERQIRNNAKRFAAEGFATAFYDGVDTTTPDAILNGYARQLWKVRMTNPEYSSAYKTMSYMHEIESDIIPRYAESLDETAVAEARRDAYISAIHQGVLYEQAPDGQMVYRYTVPEKVTTTPAELTGQVKKFVDRYGEQYNPTVIDTREYLAQNGIELDSDEIREQSYTGFRNIIDAIKDEENPDTAQLEWYYQNMHYGEHLGDLTIAMQRYAESDEKAKRVLKSFLEQKPEYQDWLRQKAEDDDDETLDTEYEVYNLEEEDLPEVEDISTLGETTRRAIEYVSQQWGIDVSQIDTKIMAHIDRSGFMFDLIHKQNDDRETVEPASSIEEARKREIENANKPFSGEKSGGSSKSEKKYAKREIWTKEEKEILTKAKVLALHYIRQRLQETGVDPGAEVLKPVKLSSCNYILLRFGCDGSNHVIGESPDSEEASMYTWYGEGDGFKKVFSSGITKREAKAMAGVRAFPHIGGFEGLHGVHDKVLDHFVSRGVLSIENKTKINNTYEAA